VGLGVASVGPDVVVLGTQPGISQLFRRASACGIQEAAIAGVSSIPAFCRRGQLSVGIWGYGEVTATRSTRWSSSKAVGLLQVKITSLTLLLYRPLSLG